MRGSPRRSADAPRLARRPTLVVKTAYSPVLSRLERGAYIAAHRLMSEEIFRHDLAAPGGRRSAHIDAIARVIIEALSR